MDVSAGVSHHPSRGSLGRLAVELRTRTLEVFSSPRRVHVDRIEISGPPTRLGNAAARPGSCFSSRALLTGHLLSPTGATVCAGHRSAGDRGVAAWWERLPWSRDGFRQPGVSPEDERERQFVSVEGIAEIEKGAYQQMKLVQQMSNPKRRVPLCKLHDR